MNQDSDTQGEPDAGFLELIDIAFPEQALLHLGELMAKQLNGVAATGMEVRVGVNGLLFALPNNAYGLVVAVHREDGTGEWKADLV